MFSALLITLREGLEAALIIGIILAYLAKTNNSQGFRYVWFGTSLAIATSLIAGAAIYFTAGNLEGRAEVIFEGSALFVAAGVLTWMILWMRKQAINIKGNLHAQINSALKSGSLVGLLVLAFIAVVREGIETALFVFAATRVTESFALSILGAMIGLALAVGIGYGIYRGASKLNLSVFFNITSLLLILFAAGLLAHGIHEFHEAGLIPPIIDHVWDINHIIPEQSTFGRFLTAIFGYNGNPSLVEVVAYFSYVIVALGGYFLISARTRKAKPSAEIAYKDNITERPIA
ncbi:MAG: FTR1 family protein [Dehalococcoidia bacterium]|nr:FTR1 family protein [Dehalococcoidia bacterium]